LVSRHGCITIHALMTIRRAFYTLIGLLAFYSLFHSWRQPLLSSHSYRQTQTAQTAQIFLEEGWHPFLPKVHFLGRPGYLILEFPLYQSLVAGLSRVAGLPVQKSGRLINCLAAVLLAWGVAEVLIVLLHGFNPETPEVSQLHKAMTVLVMSSPLVFAMSQWLSIELLSCTCSIWALWLFLKMSHTHNSPSFGAYMGLFMLTLGAFAIKPNTIFTILPFFAVVAWQEDRRRWLRLGIPLVLAFVIGASWYIHGTKVAHVYTKDLSPVDHISHLTMGDKFFFSPDVLKRFLERFTLYVFGPGTILFMLWAGWQTGGSAIRARIKQYRFWVLACCLSTFIYLFIFCGANYYHNYYQLPTIIPVYLGLGLLIPVLWRPITGVVLLIAIVANVTVSGMRLTLQDQDWIAAVSYLQKELGIGTDKPDLLVISNSSATTPILGFYLDRYATAQDLKTFTTKAWSSTRDRVAICDNREGGDCLSALQAKGFTSTHKTSFGKLDIYL
jgi:hypothetical protein